jgi:hypothetical protein
MIKPHACARSRSWKMPCKMRNVIFAAVMMMITAALGSLDSARAEKSCSGMYAGCLNFCNTQRPTAKCRGFCPSELESCKKTGTWNGIGGQHTGLKRD